MKSNTKNFHRRKEARRVLRRSEAVLILITAVFLAAAAAVILPGHDQAAQLVAVTETAPPEPAAATIEPQGPVDVNTAGVEELDRLPGIGEVLAGRIIAYRDEHGPFESVEDLLAVSGIGEQTCDELRGLITFGEEN